MSTSPLRLVRLAPDPLQGGGMPDGDVDVVWEVSHTEDFAELWGTGTVVATASYAHSVHVVVPVQAGGPWFYRFRAGQYTSPVGRTQAAPSATAEPAQVRVASASCQNYQDGFYTAWADVAAARPDLVVFLGDYIYESGAATVGVGGVVRSHGTPEPTTLEAYRDRYALYKSDPDLQAAHAACPWIITWDDHEVENNYAGLTPQDPADAAGFAERRRAAYQAWWEHQPVALPPPVDGLTIYRTARWGDLLELVVLDGRQYRTDQACGDPGLSLDPPCDETFDATRTMLGDEQEAWLFEQIAGTQSMVVLCDASGTILHSGTNRAGSSRVVQGTPPFRLVVGNSANVVLEQDGKAVDLAAHTRGSVARLTLP